MFEVIKYNDMKYNCVAKVIVDNVKYYCSYEGVFFYKIEDKFVILNDDNIISKISKIIKLKSLDNR